MVDVKNDIAICCINCQEGLGVCPNEVFMVDSDCYDEFINKQLDLYNKTGDKAIFANIKLAHKQKKAMLNLENSPLRDTIFEIWDKQDRKLRDLPQTPLM